MSLRQHILHMRHAASARSNRGPKKAVQGTTAVEHTLGSLVQQAGGKQKQLKNRSNNVKTMPCQGVHSGTGNINPIEV